MEHQDYPEDIDFQKYWLILKRHWLPATMVWVFTAIAALGVALLSEKQYQAYGKLKFKKQSTTSALVTEAGEKIGTLEPLNLQDSPIDTEAEVLRSVPILMQTIEELDLTTEEGEPISYETFREGLGVKALQGTDVLLVSYKSPEPEEAEAVVNRIMETYIENNVLVNRAEAAAARAFINEQLPKTEKELQKAEAALRTFKEQYNIVKLEEEASLSVIRISELESQIDQVKARVEQQTARIEDLQNKIGRPSEEALLQSNVSSSIEVQQLREELQEIEKRLAREQSRFRDAHPMVLKLKQQKAQLRAELEQQVNGIVNRQRQPLQARDLQGGELQNVLIESLVSYEAERKGAIEQLRSLIRSRNEHQQRAQILPKLKQMEQDLERQVDAAKSTYEILLKRLQEVRIAENQNVGNAQIISPAMVSEYPVSTSRKMILAFGIVLGGVFYVVTAFLLELIDPSIKTSKELRKILNYTLLAMIPNTHNKRRLRRRKIDEKIPEVSVIKNPTSMIGESYRMLQANLNFLSPDRKLQVIVVTSSVTKEGKSTVAANLAAAMAELGNRVLLMDADLRHPIQHHIWNLTNAKGLSDAIVGQLEPHQVARPVAPNLDVLPSGVIPPNSLALLSSKRMNCLVQECRESYDFVVLDTPPLLLVADALTVSKMSDGILLVARPGLIDSASANAAKQRLDQSGQTVLGIAMNGVVGETEPDSYFHYAEIYYKENSHENIDGGGKKMSEERKKSISH